VLLMDVKVYLIQLIRLLEVEVVTKLTVINVKQDLVKDLMMDGHVKVFNLVLLPQLKLLLIKWHNNLPQRKNVLNFIINAIMKVIKSYYVKEIHILIWVRISEKLNLLELMDYKLRYTRKKMFRETSKSMLKMLNASNE